MSGASSEFRPPDDTVIWRYMKLNSFIELLSGRLVQTRIDVSGDAAEGAFGWRAVRFSPAVLARVGLTRNDGALSDEVIRRARTFAAATYWFEFDRESFGMWNVYGRSGESVAIETTVGTLREILSRNGDARVERMRYSPMRGEIADLHTLFFHKRREYKEEREIRSVQIFSEPLPDRIAEHRVDARDLNKLMRKIVLAPDSRKTFQDAMERVVGAIFWAGGGRYTGEICRSVLDEDLVPQ